MSQVRSLNGWVFDCTVSEEHTLDSTITESPIETGASLSDHQYLMPAELVVKTIVSNTPLYTLTGDPFSGGYGERRVNALAMLRKLQSDGVLFDVQTGFVLYQNMALKTIKVPDDAKNAGWGVFTLTLRQVAVKSTQNVSYVPSSATGAATQATPTSANGAQQGTATNATTNANKPSSLAVQLANATGWNPL